MENDYKYPNIRNTNVYGTDKYPIHITRDEYELNRDKYRVMYAENKEKEYVTGLPSFIGYDTVPIMQHHIIKRSIYGKVVTATLKEEKRPLRYDYDRGRYGSWNNQTPLSDYYSISGFRTIIDLNKTKEKEII